MLNASKSENGFTEEERLRALIHEHRDRSAQEMVQAITEALTQFRRTAPQQDDITLVVVKTESLPRTT